MPLTDYKVGQTIKSNNSSFYFKVLEVRSNGDIKVQVYMPSGSAKFYSFGSGWVGLPGTNQLIINKNMKVSLRTQTKTYKEIWDGWNWFGNIRKPNNSQSSWYMVYGSMVKRFNYRSSDPPHWQGEKEFIETCGRKTSDWSYVSGTYKWNNTVNNGNWSGWVKGSYTDRVSNSYKRPVIAKLRSKHATINNTDASITIDKIRVIPDTAPAVSIKDELNGNKVIPEGVPYKRTGTVKPFWDLDGSEFTYTVSNTTYKSWKAGSTASSFNIIRYQRLTTPGIYTLTVTEKNKYTGKTDSSTVTIHIIDPTPADIVIKDANRDMRVMTEAPGTYNSAKSIKPTWAQDTTKFKYTRSDMTYTDLDGNTSNIDIQRDSVLSNYGTYTLTVEEENLSSGESDSYSVIMVISDPVPPPRIDWFEKTEPSLIYDFRNQVFIDTRYPTITIPDKCVLISATINGGPFSLGSPVTENGLYTLKAIVEKTTNKMQSIAEGNFIIDNVPPDPPIIRIGDGVEYQGKDYGLVERRFPNPVTPSISVQEGAIVIDRKLYYKKNLWETSWTEIPWKATLSDRGIYRIEAKAKKLSNGLISEMTAVEFYKKIKYRYSITLNPNDYCYRTIATVNFPDDPFLKFQYKLGDGEWKWYRDPVKIYDNTIMYVRSLDGDDDYESEITAKIIDIIDKKPPTEPVIGGVSEGDVKASPVIPTLIG
jgi:hypothetical protein